MLVFCRHRGLKSLKPGQGGKRVDVFARRRSTHSFRYRHRFSWPELPFSWSATIVVPLVFPGGKRERHARVVW